MTQKHDCKCVKNLLHPLFSRTDPPFFAFGLSFQSGSWHGPFLFLPPSFHSHPSPPSPLKVYAHFRISIHGVGISLHCSFVFFGRVVQVIFFELVETLVWVYILLVFQVIGSVFKEGTINES